MAAKSMLSLRNIGIATVALVGTGVGVAAYEIYGTAPEQIVREPRMVKVSELPVYGNPEAVVKVLPEKINPLRQSIKSVRIVIWDWLDSVEGTTTKLKEKIDTGKAHTQMTVDMIKDNPGTVVKVGAITSAGAVGWVLGYRGGIVKRSLYGSVFAVATAIYCYPRKTADLGVGTLNDVKESVISLVKGKSQEAPVETDVVEQTESTESVEKDN